MAKWDFCSFHMWKSGHNLSYKIWSVHISDMKIWMKQFYMKYACSQSLCLSRSHVWMWEMDYKIRWAGKLMLLNCGVGEGSWESLGWLGEIQPVHPKGHQSWIFFARTGAKGETPILWSPDVKNWHIGKDPNAGKGSRQEEEGQHKRDKQKMASLNQWIWVWVNLVSWWPTGRPDMLQFIWTKIWTWLSHKTELNWTEHGPVHQKKNQLPPQLVFR